MAPHFRLPRVGKNHDFKKNRKNQCNRGREKAGGKWGLSKKFFSSQKI